MCELVQCIGVHPRVFVVGGAALGDKCRDQYSCDELEEMQGDNFRAECWFEFSNFVNGCTHGVLDGCWRNYTVWLGRSASTHEEYHNS